MSLHRYGDQRTTCESSLLLQSGSRGHAWVSRPGAFTLWAISLVSIRPLPVLREKSHPRQIQKSGFALTVPGA